MADKASKLGIAQVDVRAVHDQLDKDLKTTETKVEQAMKGISDRAGKILSGIGQTITKGLEIGIGAIVGGATLAGGALLKLAKDAMPLENIQNAFAGISGDAGKMLDTLRAGSLGMVRDTDLMASYNTAAQLVGKTFADQLPSAMGYLSKVSAATGQDMGFMIDSLVKGVGRLSPMILDNLGIQVTLADATARAAEMYGVEEGALTKAQIQAGMMDVVLSKLRENTAKMPEVVGTAAQKWQSLQIKMQNWKDKAGLALLPILNKLLDPLIKMSDRVLPKLTGFIENTLVPKMEKIGYLASGIGELWRASGGDIGTFMDLLTGRLIKIGDELGIPKEKLEGFLGKVKDLTLAIVDFVDKTKTFVDEHGPAVKKIVGEIVDKAGELWQKLTDVSTVLGDKIEKVIAVSTTSWTDFRTNVLEPMRPILDLIAQGFDAIKAAIDRARDAYQLWLLDRELGTEPTGGGGGGGGAGGEGDEHRIDQKPFGFAAGGDFVVRAPTLMTVGENWQPEHVVVTPLSGQQQGPGGGGYHFTYVDQSGVHKGRAQDMSRQLEHRFLLGLN